ncbi:hypothetical protein C8R43DRAFT_942167 [Mycena crocata]|nr:hypothetical protein C8R43DRAFT_942167 [Mycena crocata]
MPESHATEGRHSASVDHVDWPSFLNLQVPLSSDHLFAELRGQCSHYQPLFCNVFSHRVWIISSPTGQARWALSKSQRFRGSSSATVIAYARSPGQISITPETGSSLPSEQAVESIQTENHCHDFASGPAVSVPSDMPTGDEEPPLSPTSITTSPTLDAGSSFGMQGIDTLQPMNIPTQLKPTWPAQLLSSSEPATFTVLPLQTDFRSKSLPPGWISYNQFEGKVFFYHKEKNVLTETWIYDPIFYKAIWNFIEMIDALVEDCLSIHLVHWAKLRLQRGFMQTKYGFHKILKWF